MNETLDVSLLSEATSRTRVRFPTVIGAPMPPLWVALSSAPVFNPVLAVPIADPPLTDAEMKALLADDDPTPLNGTDEPADLVERRQLFAALADVQLNAIVRATE